MKTKNKQTAAAGLLAAALLSSCNLPSLQSQAPTNTGGIQTAAAVQTNSGPSIEATGRALQTPLANTTVTMVNKPTQTPTPSEDAAQCRNRADFIDDVSVPDNAEFDRGDSFIKIWRLRNTGNCSWTTTFLLTFIGGNRLAAPSSVALSSEVPPGGLIDLAVDMQAPNEAGTFQGFWKLRSPEGSLFGIGPQGDQSFWVKIVVPQSATSEASPSESATPTPSASPTPTSTMESTAIPTSTPTPTATLTPTSTGSATPTNSPSP